MEKLNIKKQKPIHITQKIIGVSGKSGSGKTSLSNYIITNFPTALHFEIDKLGHASLKDKDCQKLLLHYFGTAIFTKDEVNRKSLGTIVYNNSDKMQDLITCTWPYMNKKIKEFLDTNKNNIIILDWLLLPKTDYFKQCNLSIYLDIDQTTRCERIIKRDNITQEKFYERDNNSPIYDKNLFDIVLTNNNYEAVKERIKKL